MNTSNELGAAEREIAELSQFSLRIGNDDFEHWSSIEVTHSIDAFSSVGFTAPFEPRRRAFRDAFRPLSYRPVSVLLGSPRKGDHQLQLTGRLTNVEPDFGPNGTSVTVQANSLPSAFFDCAAPAKMTNGHEYSGLDLEAIADELAKPFGFNARFADERSTLIDTNRDGRLERDRSSDAREQRRISEEFSRAFPRVKIESDQKIFDFLLKLAQQRGVLLTDSPTGDLVFQRPAATGRPVVHLEEGQAPLLSIKPTFRPDAYFSEVTAIVSQKRGRKGGRFTLQNPFLTRDSIVRPMSFRACDTDVGAGPQVAADYMSRMFGEVASWEIELPTILDPQNEFFRPNTTLTVKAPSAMIFGTHELLIRQVTKRQTKDSTTCTLTVVLPCAYTGEMPTVLPWNEAL
jgi:prophage tail gpP-like protein